VVLSTRKRSFGCTWPMVCTSLLSSSSSPTPPGPSGTLYRGTGRPLNPWPILVPRSPLLPSFLQTHTLVLTRDSESQDLGFYRHRLLTSFLSWTFLTWIVVIGSSVVMLLWIVIFSFFRSNDFNDEVVILFGNIPFWASVVISIVIALGEPPCIESFRPLLICLQHHDS